MNSPSGFPHSGKFRGSQNCFEKKLSRMFTDRNLHATATHTERDTTIVIDAVEHAHARTHIHTPTHTLTKQIHPHAHTRSRAHAPFHSKTKKNFATSILLCSLSDGACSNQPFYARRLLWSPRFDIDTFAANRLSHKWGPYVDLFRERQKLKHFRCSKKPPI